MCVISELDITCSAKSKWSSLKEFLKNLFLSSWPNVGRNWLKMRRKSIARAVEKYENGRSLGITAEIWQLHKYLFLLVEESARLWHPCTDGELVARIQVQYWVDLNSTKSRNKLSRLGRATCNGWKMFIMYIYYVYPHVWLFFNRTHRILKIFCQPSHLRKQHTTIMALMTVVLLIWYSWKLKLFY